LIISVTHSIQLQYHCPLAVKYLPDNFHCNAIHSNERTLNLPP